MYAENKTGVSIPAGTSHMFECMPTLCPSWSSPDSGSDPLSLSKGHVQPFRLQWWHRGSCTHPELRPNEKRILYWGIQLPVLSWIFFVFIYQYWRIFDKPPASRRRSVSSWCWAEGHSGYLCKHSAPLWRFPQGRTFFRQHHWHTQTWWESWAGLPGLTSAWWLGLKDP